MSMQRTVVCPQLCQIKDHYASLKTYTPVKDFTFVVLADPQFGLLERYVEKRAKPHHWDRELKLFNRAINIVNRLRPRPLFVMICGDIVDAEQGSEYYQKQTTDILSALGNFDPSISVFTLPGNHDVGDYPSETSITGYCKTWGDDYYVFEANQVRFLVLNSQLLWSDKNCLQQSQQFNTWLSDQLQIAANDQTRINIAFQHIPFYVEDKDEPDDYFNLPNECRSKMLSRLHSANIGHLFTGHLHRNSLHTWLPPDPPNPNASPLELVTTSSVCVPLGDDPPGLRLVHVSSDNTVKHVYWSLDDLEALLDKNEQPVSDVVR